MKKLFTAITIIIVQFFYIISISASSGTMTVSASVTSVATVTISGGGIATVTPQIRGGTEVSTSSVNSISANVSEGVPYYIAIDAGISAGATVEQRYLTRVGGSEEVPYYITQNQMFSAGGAIIGNVKGVNALYEVGTGGSANIPFILEVNQLSSLPAGEYKDTVTISIIF